MEIDEKKFYSMILSWNQADRGKFITQIALDMFQGKCIEPWIKKEVKKRKKPNEAYSEQFLEFWAAYPSCPNKSGKGAAWKEWNECCAIYRILNSGNDVQAGLLKHCLSALSWQKLTDKWTADNGKYICKPENYLKDRMFEDEQPQGLKAKEQYTDMNGEIKWR